MEIQKVSIDLKTGHRTTLVATIQNERDENHKIYFLLYEGWRSEWVEIA